MDGMFQIPKLQEHNFQNETKESSKISYSFLSKKDAQTATDCFRPTEIQESFWYPISYIGFVLQFILKSTGLCIDQSWYSYIVVWLSVSLLIIH